jgi:hypothetical protein
MRGSILSRAGISPIVPLGSGVFSARFKFRRIWWRTAAEPDQQQQFLTGRFKRLEAVARRNVSAAEPDQAKTCWRQTAPHLENIMSKKDLPPVPPAGRTNKGQGHASSIEKGSDLKSDAAEPRHRNIDKQGRQGNVAVNTRNQGYQQDR